MIGQAAKASLRRWRAQAAPTVIHDSVRHWFDPAWYAGRHRQVAASGLAPLDHFAQIGAAQGLDPHPLVDMAFYLDQAGADPQSRAQSAAALVRHGIAVGRSPHPLFDLGYYLDQNPDVARSNTDAFLHYLLFGAAERRKPHPLFDIAYYLDNHPGLAESGQNPLLHYLADSTGDPNAAFDTVFYKTQAPELNHSGENPLLHYLRTGTAQGLRTHPGFDPDWYAALHRHAMPAGTHPIAWFLQNGAKPGQGQPPQPRHKLAVVFLARSETGSTLGLDTFPRTYAQFDAGIDHDLVVIRKGGTRKRGASLALELMFEDRSIAGRQVDFIDLEDVGYDIQAYMQLAGALRHEYVCFLNSHSEIACDGWLAKLFAPLEHPGIGVAGATASYESIIDTLHLNDKIAWLGSTDRLPWSDDLFEWFGDVLDVHARHYVQAGPDRAHKPDPHAARDGAIPYDDAIAFARRWMALTRPGGVFHDFTRFKRFPNPHIRTNAFLMRRETLVGLGVRLENSKASCLEFESGPTGLQARIEQAGLRAVLVAADGAWYDVEDWPKSRTFRLGDQSNTMVKDNRVREVETSPDSARRRLDAVTWGEYLAPIPPVLAQFGIPFDKGDLRQPTPGRHRPASPAKPLISLVIPTHNRLALTADALSTVLAQRYDHFECVVFDNASQEPLGEHVASLADPRIRFARSDAFLSVTESWNTAIDLARGDYVILIGDDDGLLPDSLDTFADIVARFDAPDLVYSAFLQFLHPGVAPWEPSGSVSDSRHGFFFTQENDPFLLPKDIARLAVVGSLQFRRSFTYNMQGLLFKREFLDTLRRNGRVFHSPFPDYYIANVAFIQADTIVVCPKPNSVAGVSRKSFGFTLFNNMPERGAALLNNPVGGDPAADRTSAYALPGSAYITNFAVTMEHVVDALGDRTPAPLRSDRYRRAQILESLGGPATLLAKPPGETLVTDLAALLHPDERTWLDHLLVTAAAARANDPDSTTELHALAAATTIYAPVPDRLFERRLWIGEHATLPELFATLSTLSTR